MHNFKMAKRLKNVFNHKICFPCGWVFSLLLLFVHSRNNWESCIFFSITFSSTINTENNVKLDFAQAQNVLPIKLVSWSLFHNFFAKKTHVLFILVSRTYIQTFTVDSFCAVQQITNEIAFHAIGNMLSRLLIDFH